MKPSLVKYYIKCGKCGKTNVSHYYTGTPEVWICVHCESYFTLSRVSEAGEPFFKYGGPVP